MAATKALDPAPFFEICQIFQERNPKRHLSIAHIKTVFMNLVKSNRDRAFNEAYNFAASFMGVVVKKPKFVHQIFDFAKYYPDLSKMLQLHFEVGN